MWFNRLYMRVQRPWEWNSWRTSSGICPRDAVPVAPQRSSSSAQPVQWVVPADASSGGQRVPGPWRASPVLDRLADDGDIIDSSWPAFAGHGASF